MTMRDVAAARYDRPADAVRTARSSGQDESADAPSGASDGFPQMLSNLAHLDGANAQAVTVSGEAQASPLLRWQLREVESADEGGDPPDGDPQRVDQADAAAAAAPAVDPAAMAALVNGVAAQIVPPSTDGNSGAAPADDCLAALVRSLAGDGRPTDTMGLEALAEPVQAAVARVTVANFAVPNFTVTGRETHFAPVALPSPAGDLARRLDAAAVPSGDVTVEADTEAPGERDANTGAALRSQPPASGVANSTSGDPRQAGDNPSSRQNQARARVDLPAEPMSALGQPKDIASKDGPGPALTGGSPTQQIADRIFETLLPSSTGAPGGFQPTAEPGPDRVAGPSAGPDSAAVKPPLASMVKVLTINLQPAELGTVVVRMSLSRNTLDIQIEAARPDTARRLQSDSDTLSHLLRSAGVQVDGVTVRTVDSGTTASTGSSQAQLDNSSQSRSGGAQPDARSSGGQQPRPQSDPSTQSQSRAHESESRDPSRAGGGLYV